MQFLAVGPKIYMKDAVLSPKTSDPKHPKFYQYLNSIFFAQETLILKGKGIEISFVKAQHFGLLRDCRLESCQWDFVFFLPSNLPSGCQNTPIFEYFEI